METRSPGEAVTIVILAGGRASRLGGVDKAGLDIGGRPLIERLLATVRPIASRILMVTNDSRFDGVPDVSVIRDPEPHGGVLPALLAALDEATTPLVVTLACDMPFVSRDVLVQLLTLADGHDVVMPYVDGIAQPMHAVYRRVPCHAAVAAALNAGKRRMIAFLDDVDTLAVDEADLRRIDPALRTFFNVNTPDDLAEARRIAAG